MADRPEQPAALPVTASLLEARLAAASDAPFLAWRAGDGHVWHVAEQVEEVSPEIVEALPAGIPAGAGDGGWLLLVSYDRHAPAAARRSPCRAFRVGRARRLEESPGAPAAPAPTAALGLRPTVSDAAYEALVTRALADIRRGRFYQINLLRYFQVEAAAGSPDAGWIAARLARFGGPHAAWLELPDLRLVSFSPERFVEVMPPAAAGGSPLISACPVKGTAARVDDQAADLRVADGLAGSPKDRAELAMIVDLMRHDLWQVARPGTVRVADPGAVRTYATVHHLVATVEAALRPGVSVGELLAALCPAGSITGAPKVEVMEAIREWEGRERGYFMGHICWVADSGRFDSSILIRTLVGRGAEPFEYAAGSGIVIGSDPGRERQEIAGKCRVVVQPG